MGSPGVWCNVLVVLIIGVVGILVKVVTPPPGSTTLDGSQLTAPRVQMRDGRFLAYKQVGVPLETAKHVIVHVHGYGGSRHLTYPISQEVTEEDGVCMISFDRAGYGQSDANPNRSIKSEADDVVDLADGLGLGRRFYVTTVSIGGYTGWGLLKYHPDRLAGMAMQAPATNFWWSGLPASAVKAGWAQLALGDKMAFCVWHYFPVLTYWHMTQTWLPTSSVAPHAGLQNFSPGDQELMKLSGSRLAKTTPEHSKEAAQRGPIESTFRDLTVMFSSWDFSPLEIRQPSGSVSVHIWQGTEDYLVPVQLQRAVANAHPWVQYHELPNHGHFLNGVPGIPDRVVRTLLGTRTTTAN
ncbi:hypothetical protein M758_9G106100 [Ceratodon purpureus]|uniref:AB hydrolase-1 domain-containing protein n=1 Tax=Ceratodon purpureus TaxID=3225 RepID=A0A8T0GT86_CERPU|nr:hypothetical protein KC19_9G091200 [Ceratodon purpureus]KAG0606013.1 hypothetical protein M758_9G106100 [Ceratodon purpureus]